MPIAGIPVTLIPSEVGEMVLGRNILAIIARMKNIPKGIDMPIKITLTKDKKVSPFVWIVDMAKASPSIDFKS